MPSRRQGETEKQRKGTIAAVRAGMKTTVWCGSPLAAENERLMCQSKLTDAEMELVKFDWPGRIKLTGGRNAH